MSTIDADGLQLASLTDVGRRRTGNEDSHSVWVSDDATELARLGALLVVADGMGGANAGEVASKLAIDTVVETYRASTGDDPAEALRLAIEAANSAVNSQASANSDQRGMGTTCTAVVLRDRHIWLGHVGDSRAYLVRGGVTHKLTRDHSLVSELVERGHLTEQEAKHDPRRNVVTRSVGALPDVEVDAEGLTDALRPGDALLLCSDGLHGQVTDSEIAMLTGEHPPEEACRLLIELANERGGPDNITAIVVRVPGEAAPPLAAAPAAAAKAKKSDDAPKGGLPPFGVLLGVVVVLIALVAIIGSTLWKQVRTPADGGASMSSSDTGAAAEAPAAEAPPEAAPGASKDVAATPEPSAPVAATPAPATPAGKTPATATLPPATTPPVKGAKPVPGRPAAVTPPASTPAAAAPAAAPVATEVVVVSRPFQPCTFKVDGQLLTQDVGSVTLRDLAPGAHIISVTDGRGRTVNLTANVGETAALELVAQLPGADRVGDLDVTLAGADKARLFVDGAQYPRLAPCVVRGLSPGLHRIKAITLGSPRRVADLTDVEVRAGGSARVEVQFP